MDKYITEAGQKAAREFSAEQLAQIEEWKKVYCRECDAELTEQEANDRSDVDGVDNICDKCAA